MGQISGMTLTTKSAMDYIIDSETLRYLLVTGRKALRGDSNDAEHDALYAIVEMLDKIRSESEQKLKRADQRSQ